jgi:predicted enzyme related to lactoylglutathione lyase
MSEKPFNTLNYFELPSDNNDQLKQFYNIVFNWTFEEGKDTSDYWYTESAGIKGALLKRRTPEQNAPTLEVRVESIDDTISKAKSAGAKVVVVHKQAISEGTFAIMKDPQQNIMGIWQSK